MTDLPNTLERHRLPLDRDRMKQAARLAAPAMTFARRNPFILIGAAVVGVAGVMAWRNREKIAASAQPLLEKAQPLIDDARLKGHALIDDAKTKGEELIEQAKTAGEAVVAKARTRKPAAAKSEPAEIH